MAKLIVCPYCHYCLCYAVTLLAYLRTFTLTCTLFVLLLFGFYSLFVKFLHWFFGLYHMLCEYCSVFSLFLYLSFRISRSLSHSGSVIIIKHSCIALHSIVMLPFVYSNFIRMYHTKLNLCNNTIQVLSILI